MAVKQVERRICDYCDKEAYSNPCCLCRKDFCYAHGSFYMPADAGDHRSRFDLCDVCVKEFAAKVSQAIGGDHA